MKENILRMEYNANKMKSSVDNIGPNNLKMRSDAIQMRQSQLIMILNRIKMT